MSGKTRKGQKIKKSYLLCDFKIDSVVMVKSSKGSTCMEYWTDFNGELNTLDFLPKKNYKRHKNKCP